MKILFCAYMGQIMEEDAGLLRRLYPVEIIDFLQFASSFTQILKYLFNIFNTIIPGVLRNDLVYIWTVDYPAFPIIVLAKLFRKKVVLHISGYEVCGDKNQRYGSQLGKVHGAAVRWCLRNTDCAIVMSEAYAKITMIVEPKTKLAVIPGGISPDLYAVPLPEKKEQAVLAYHEYTGVENIKGISIYKEAAKHIPYECKVIKDMDHNQLMKVLLETKVYCQISYTECFGMTVLEAMACGCVPVVTNRGALPELVGDTGVVIHYGGIMEAAYGIQKAMKLSGESARERAKLFSNELRSTRLKTVLEEVMD